MEPLSHRLIDEASAYLEGKVKRTPVERSEPLSKLLDRPVWMKLENRQTTGSFKVRGAMFALYRARLDGADRVAACSAGNHGKGLAFAGRELGVGVVIYVPAGVDPSKLSAMRGLGAEVHVSEFPGFDESEALALEEAERHGIPYISAYDNPLVMAGNGGTIADEVAIQVSEARSFVMPAGGGGHAAGFAFRMESLRAGCSFILCQHAGCPALRLSMQTGEAVRRMPPVETLASGLEGGFGENTFSVLRNRVTQICESDERSLRQAMAWMYREHGLRIEGSSAVAVAALLSGNEIMGEGEVVLFVSGGNIDDSAFDSVIAGG